VGITNPPGVTAGLETLCAADFMDPNLGPFVAKTGWKAGM
jgi:hypothetical protein